MSDISGSKIDVVSDVENLVRLKNNKLNLNSYAKTDIMEYFNLRSREYEEGEYRDEELKIAVKEDFSNFNEEAFEKVE